MSGTRMTPPGNANHLHRLIAEIATAEHREVRRIQRALTNTIIGQTLPSGVVKGGTAIKLRLGEAGSRFRPDLDVARSHGIGEPEYVEALAERLRRGWGGFAGTIERDARPAPEDVPRRLHHVALLD